MNKSVFFLMGALSLLSGCSQKYVVTLSNGTRVGTTSKPKLQQGYYHFKDVNGRETVVPDVRVREISPASMAEDEKTKFQGEIKKKK